MKGGIAAGEGGAKGGCPTIDIVASIDFLNPHGVGGKGENRRPVSWLTCSLSPVHRATTGVNIIHASCVCISEMTSASLIRPAARSLACSFPSACCGNPITIFTLIMTRFAVESQWN